MFIFSLTRGHLRAGVQQSHVDEVNKVVTAPAYMYEAPLHHIFDGIGNMVTGVVKFIKS